MTRHKPICMALFNNAHPYSWFPDAVAVLMDCQRRAKLSNAEPPKKKPTIPCDAYNNMNSLCLQGEW